MKNAAMSGGRSSNADDGSSDRQCSSAALDTAYTFATSSAYLRNGLILGAGSLPGLVVDVPGDSGPAGARGIRSAWLRARPPPPPHRGSDRVRAPLAASRRTSGPLSPGPLPLALPGGEGGIHMTLVPLVEPGHLDRLEDLLVRSLRIVDEPRQLAAPAVQVRAPDGERIDVRVPVRERDRDLPDVGPAHGRPPLGSDPVPRDPHHHVGGADPGLAPEPRPRRESRRLLEPVVLAPLDLRERPEPLLHPDVARRARAHAAAVGGEVHA